MDLQFIFDRFCLISGLDEETAAPYMALCSEAAADISKRVKKGVDSEAESVRLSSAAAALAFYRYAKFTAAAQGSISFSAGDVRVVSDGEKALLLAGKVRDEALAEVSDLLWDDGFVLRQV